MFLTHRRSQCSNIPVNTVGGCDFSAPCASGAVSACTATIDYQGQVGSVSSTALPCFAFE